MKATKIIYLIHSMVYDIQAKANPQAHCDTNSQICLDRELACEKRWQTAIESEISRPK